MRKCTASLSHFLNSALSQSHISTFSHFIVSPDSRSGAALQMLVGEWGIVRLFGLKDCSIGAARGECNVGMWEYENEKMRKCENGEMGRVIAGLQMRGGSVATNARRNYTQSGEDAALMDEVEKLFVGAAVGL